MLLQTMLDVVRGSRIKRLIGTLENVNEIHYLVILSVIISFFMAFIYSRRLTLGGVFLAIKIFLLYIESSIHTV